MAAEIICVGTEILLGDIVNSNSRFLARELAELGIPHFFQSVVGDNIQRIHSLIDIAIARESEILIFTGGLGPTPDDLTTEAIATYFDTELIEQPEIVADIEAKFAKRGRTMVDSNRRQALLPKGADILPNPIGTAPGIIWQPQANLTIFTFPGVPYEMHRMWQDTAVPFLKSQGWGQSIIHSEMMRFRGIGESTLASKVHHLFEQENPTVAPYASKGEVKLRVSAKADSVETAKQLIAPVVDEIKAIAGLHYFGSDDDSLASVLGELLGDRQQTLSVAESCTAGGLGAMITSISGASSYFMGGVISYQNRIKQDLLGVKAEDIETVGAVSETVAEQMALGAKKYLQTDWAIAISGIAGPKSDDTDKPVGMVCIAWADPKAQVTSKTFYYGENRARDLIRYLSACDALDGLRRQLLTTQN
ncbi:competence/damage-inducible protein cinA [[Leptolyngbya] sp. PCC 7376]|uniref:competence/damage-inducible protein A n=1 Tax=[Leptolyngbya] sp. PCC 7376 TaxID=111781 RepID=UPI00029EEC41|nr:competence/damage-inducible protein A [[Leptolyngbya] sp. PCC 7376]AFY38948.1 competence/damage-inducible protein cinA [[Leptolyngbya] sp. PCC 7376]